MVASQELPALIEPCDQHDERRFPPPFPLPRSGEGSATMRASWAGPTAAVTSSFLDPLLRGWPDCPLLRASSYLDFSTPTAPGRIPVLVLLRPSSEHILIVRAPGARGQPSRPVATVATLSLLRRSNQADLLRRIRLFRGPVRQFVEGVQVGSS
jgi:hypothetical protein